MKINKEIFRASDIRGVVNKDVSPDFAFALGKAYGTLLKRRSIDKAVVGHDFRETSPEYSKAVISGLTWAGIDVIDIGLHLVGTFYWSQYFFKRKGGIYISASHNPREFNGFKMAIGYSENITSDDVQLIANMMEEDDFEKAESEGKAEKQDITKDYIKDIITRVPLKRSFKIVVDASFATAGIIAPDLFRAAGCTVIERNTKLDPTFPLGAADPTEAKVAKRLSRAVLEEKADIGFSFDSDGDRLGIVDEKGNIIWADVLIALFAIDALDMYPKASIMYNILCSKLVEETIIKYGGKPFMWRVGYSLLKHKNQEVGAVLIGELSGHFFFSKDYYNHDDGLYSAMRVLRFLDRTNQTLSSAVGALPQYISSPEIKLYCADKQKVGFIKKISVVLKRDHPKAIIVDDERAGDGIRLDLPASMFVIRYSQNGPYITIKFEAKEQKEYDELKAYISQLLHEHDEIDWSSSINVNTEALI